MLKKTGKSLLSLILEAQVKTLLRKNPVQVIAVAGSVGKTSTKTAIAKSIGRYRRVRFQDGNYNDRLTVPLIFFDQKEPSIFDLVGWLKLIASNYKTIKQSYPFDVVVVELGTDAPGQIKQFSYLNPDLLVLTSIAPEHMENFKTVDSVAREELSMNRSAKVVLINTDDCELQYIEGHEYKSYGLGGSPDFRLVDLELNGIEGTSATLIWPDGEANTLALRLAGRQGAKIALAAIASANLLGIERDDCVKMASELKPVNGRMNRLDGINDSIIIDDTYNSSPSAAIAALDVLYATEAKKRIALLGSMNELGDYSKEAHESVGSYCDPKQVDLVLTLGREANELLAPAARAKGCKVESFDSPVKSAEYLKAQLTNKTVLLAKGSQNGVFAEEAIKPLLKNPMDASKLVRQSAYWLSKKV